MKKNMYDLHILTIIGMLIIGIFTIVGTFLIQKGNSIKSSASSSATQRRLEEIQNQNKELKNIIELQSKTLSSQEGLLKQQMDLIKNSEYNDFTSSFMEFQIVKQAYYNVSYMIYNSSFPKDNFLNLKRSEIEQIDIDVKTAIDDMRKSKFVTSHNEINSILIKLRMELSGKLYFLKWQVGEHFKYNDLIFTIDKIKRENEYNKLQEFLTMIDSDLNKLIPKMLTDAQNKRAGNKISGN